jgi:hypothetical protein
MKATADLQYPFWSPTLFCRLVVAHIL